MMEEVEDLLSKDFNHLFSGMKRGQWNIFECLLVFTAVGVSHYLCVHHFYYQQVISAALKPVCVWFILNIKHDFKWPDGCAKHSQSLLALTRENLKPIWRWWASTFSHKHFVSESNYRFKLLLLVDLQCNMSNMCLMNYIKTFWTKNILNLS